jgi:hypothetical protein
MHSVLRIARKEAGGSEKVVVCFVDCCWLLNSSNRSKSLSAPKIELESRDNHQVIPTPYFTCCSMLPNSRE